MNVTDLRELLDERSAGPDGNAVSPARLSDVRGRIAVRRRRRTVATVAAAAVAVAAVSLTAVTLPRAAGIPPTDRSSPTPMATISGFPEYADGTRLIGANAARPPARSVTVTVVPESLDLKFFIRCDDDAIGHRLLVNGRELAKGTGCGAAFSTRRLAEQYGVRVGRPLRVVFAKDGPPVGEFAVAVGQRVDPDSYPYPTPPATPQPLDPAGSTQDGTDARSRGGRVLRSHPADPNRPVTQTLVWPGLNSIDLVANTPGALRVAVNGVQVATAEFWSYAPATVGTGTDEDWAREHGLKLKRGQRVTVTVTPHRMRGAWEVLFDPPMTTDQN